jgi:hypothetical protein
LKLCVRVRRKTVGERLRPRPQPLFRSVGQG